MWSVISQSTFNSQILLQNTQYHHPFQSAVMKQLALTGGLNGWAATEWHQLCLRTLIQPAIKKDGTAGHIITAAFL